MKVDQVHSSKQILFTNCIRSRGSFIYGQGSVLEGGFDIVAMGEVGESRIADADPTLQYRVQCKFRKVLFCLFLPVLSGGGTRIGCG